MAEASPAADRARLMKVEAEIADVERRLDSDDYDEHLDPSPSYLRLLQRRRRRILEALNAPYLLDLSAARVKA